MQPPLVSETVDRLARSIGREADEIIDAMDARADRENFPTVGPAVGSWLALLARGSHTRRAFEFGSGFGYSAYWIARELPADGEIFLTEVDADELALARDYFEEGNLADRADFRHGDALEVVANVEGQFDFVLLDHGMERYVEAFEAIRDRMHHGGIVVADNAVEAGDYVDTEAVAALVDGDAVAGASEDTRGTAAYLRRVRDDSEFTTGLLPLGEGLSVSIHTG